MPHSPQKEIVHTWSALILAVIIQGILVPQSPSSDRQLSILESHNTVLNNNNKNQLSSRCLSISCSYLLTSNIVQREQAETLISHCLPRRGLTVYFPSCCVQFYLLINLHLGADWNPLGSPIELVGMSPAVFSWFSPRVKSSFQLLFGKSYHILYSQE